MIFISDLMVNSTIIAVYYVLDDKFALKMNEKDCADFQRLNVFLYEI